MLLLICSWTPFYRIKHNHSNSKNTTQTPESKEITMSNTIQIMANYKMLGNACFKQHKYLEALEQYNLAIETASVEAMNDNPSVRILAAELYSNCSETHISLHNYSQSLSCAKKCLELSPSWPRAHYRMIKAYLALDYPVEALSHVMDGVRCCHESTSLSAAETVMYKHAFEQLKQEAFYSVQANMFAPSGQSHMHS